MSDDVDTDIVITRLKTKRGLSAAQITAAAAILTSLLALGVSIYETRIMRAWQQASTQPIVEIRFQTNYIGTPITGEITLENMGQGTAFVEGLKINQNGEAVADLGDLISLWQPTELPLVKRGERNIYRGYLGPSEKKTPLTFSWALPDDTSFQQRMAVGQSFAESVSQTDISVCYCSVFERCWITEFKSQSRAQAVDACPSGYN